MNELLDLTVLRSLGAVTFALSLFGCAAEAPLAATEQPLVFDNGNACGTKCRGACGSECPGTCIALPPKTLCVGKGKSVSCTGKSCPTAQGCQEHDACYDQCAAAFGCDVLDANVFACQRSCDQACISKYGLAQCNAWRMGNGDEMMDFWDCAAPAADPSCGDKADLVCKGSYECPPGSSCRDCDGDGVKHCLAGSVCPTVKPTPVAAVTATAL